MKNQVKIFICICSILALFFSCKKGEEVVTPDIGYDYFPCKLKSYIVYDVDSIVYDDFKNDTTNYKFQIKEVVDSLIKDNQGRDAYRIVRYKKIYDPFIPYSQISWSLKDVWTWAKTGTTAEVV